MSNNTLVLQDKDCFGLPNQCVAGFSCDLLVTTKGVYFTEYLFEIQVIANGTNGDLGLGEDFYGAAGISADAAVRTSNNAF